MLRLIVASKIICEDRVYSKKQATYSLSRMFMLNLIITFLRSLTKKHLMQLAHSLSFEKKKNNWCSLCLNIIPYVDNSPIQNLMVWTGLRVPLSKKFKSGLKLEKKMYSLNVYAKFNQYFLRPLKKTLDAACAQLVSRKDYNNGI